MPSSNASPMIEPKSQYKSVAVAKAVIRKRWKRMNKSPNVKEVLALCKQEGIYDDSAFANPNKPTKTEGLNLLVPHLAEGGYDFAFTDDFPATVGKKISFDIVPA